MHDLHPSNGLPFVELQFQFKSRESKIDLPPFIGPTIRGAFGYALKEIVCIASHRNCERCQFLDHCTFPKLFDGRWPREPKVSEAVGPPAISQNSLTPLWLPLVPPISAKPPDQVLQFGFRLFGQAIPLWTYVVESMTRSCQRGLGSEKNRFDLISVQDGVTGKQLFESGRIEYEPQPTQAACDALPTQACRLKWSFLTPIQLKKDNRQTTFLDPLDLVLAGRRRWMNLQLAAGLAQTDENLARLERDQFSVSEINLKTWGFSRYSGRQKNSMNLFGAVGSITFTGPWHLAGQWLSAVHQIHLGGKTAFGFGQVKWEMI